MITDGLVSIDELDLAGKKVLVRVDFNVPLKNGTITDETRIHASTPTIRQLLDKGASVILMSHLGRPVEGEFDAEFSLAPVSARLAEIFAMPVPLVSDWRQHPETIPDSRLVLLENVRFETGETANDETLGRDMAALCDVFVNDAFATAHRAQASTHGVARYAPVACAGPLVLRELGALSRALADPARPMTAIVGGAKVSTKLAVLESLLGIVDQLIVGGGIANTFLAAAGFEIGTSLHEADLVTVAAGLMQKARDQGKDIPLPTDVVCGKEFDEHTPATRKPVSEVTSEDMILDVGSDTASAYANLIKSARTVVWNGPLGVFEFDQFSNGTRVLAQAVADSNAFSIAGGGDTLAAISSFGISEKISYISTAGGAFLEFLEGKELPAIAVLKQAG